MFYDTHAHLNADNFKENLKQIISEAREKKVNIINVVGFDPQTNFQANQIALKYDEVYASCGLHPTDVQHFSDEDIKKLEDYLSQDITIAVGECGLDYYWHKDTRQIGRAS